MANIIPVTYRMYIYRDSKKMPAKKVAKKWHVSVATVYNIKRELGLVEAVLITPDLYKKMWE